MVGSPHIPEARTFRTPAQWLRTYVAASFNQNFNLLKVTGRHESLPSQNLKRVQSTISSFLPLSQSRSSSPSRFLLNMSSLGTSKGVLEIAKFGIYVTVPIVLMYAFANNTKNLQKFMGNRSYVVYPADAVLPPSPEELREMARELAQKRNAH